MNVNDKQWWENKFGSGDWELNMGKAQTEYFARLIVNNIPYGIKKDLNSTGMRILDWGCALGQGVDVFQMSFPLARVSGYDFSESAIDKAKDLYPQLSFRNEPIGTDEKFDTIIISNTLEHFHGPLEVVKQHLANVGRYYIILVPYGQCGINGPFIDGCHFYSFTEETFTETFSDFTRMFFCVIPSTRPDLWAGYQLLVIYKRATD